MPNFEDIPQTIEDTKLLDSLSALSSILCATESLADKFTVFEDVKIYDQTARGCNIDFKTIVYNTSELVLHLNKIHNGDHDLTIELVTRMSHLCITTIFAINKLWFETPKVFSPIFQIGNVVARISNELNMRLHKQ